MNPQTPLKLKGQFILSMAKTRSDDSNYPSRYSPNKDENGIAWITGRQYIVELICENKAAKDNKELPAAFYHLPDWEKFYNRHINSRILGPLISKHGAAKLIAFLRENKYIMSLYPKWVREKIDKYIYKPGSNLVPMTKREFKEIKKFGKESATKSIISTLKDLE